MLPSPIPSSITRLCAFPTLRHYLLDVAVGAAVGTLNACSLDLLLSETALKSLLQSALS